MGQIKQRLPIFAILRRLMIRITGGEPQVIIDLQQLKNW
jgi:molybdenum cofactor biosynthesis enzyme MoaA